MAAPDHPASGVPSLLCAGLCEHCMTSSYARYAWSKDPPSRLGVRASGEPNRQGYVVEVDHGRGLVQLPLLVNIREAKPF